METPFSGFTPVRRREDTIASKRTSVEEGKAWTTARCNRLLRPLISRVSALGRLLPSENAATEKCATVHRTKYDDIQDEDSMRESVNGSEDDEWAPVRKKVKRTYSARLGKGTRGRPTKVKNQAYSDIRHRMPFLVPGEISVSTPMLNRAKGGFDQELEHARSNSFDEILLAKKHKRPKSRYLTKDGEAHFELSEILRELRRKTDPSRYTLYEGIYNGLEVLLKATMSDIDPTIQDRTGARSLFDTCLRNVPAVIEDEEALFASEAGERSAVEVRDVSSEIYAELEALGHGDRGWKHLRTIVRAHGIQIVGNAITQGLVRSDFAGALVRLCIHTACLDEAEMLISCLLRTASCSEPKSIHSRTSDESDMAPFPVLEKFACYTGRRSFQIRQLTNIFVAEQLPLAWLATKELGRVWTHVIQNSAVDADSSTFLTAVLPRLCSSGTKTLNFASTESVMLKALDATLASVLTALSAIALLDIEKEDEIASAEALQQPGTVLRQCLIACVSLPPPLNDYRASLLAFSNLLISPETIKDPDLFSEISKILSINAMQRSNDSFASFVCSVAFCCGRGLSNSGFSHLKLLHSRLRKYIAHPSCLDKHMIRSVITDSALTFARHNDECEHLDYAEDIDLEFRGEHIADQPRRLPTEAGVLVSSGFRWEEGISEWVTATPAFSLKKSRAKARKVVTRQKRYVAEVDVDEAEPDIYGSSPSRHNLRRGSKRLATSTPRMFRQVTKHVVKPAERHEDHNTSGAVKQSLDLPSDSGDDDDSPDTSMTTLASASDDNSSFAQKSGVGTKTLLRPSARYGLRGRSGGQARDWHSESDDELSVNGIDASSWKNSITLNKISVVVLQEPTSAVPKTGTVRISVPGLDQDVCPTRRYSTRSGNGSGSCNKLTVMPRKRTRSFTTVDDSMDDSEDELSF